MADDLGWKDLHCYGNELIDTPNLDRLANEGMRFTNADEAISFVDNNRDVPFYLNSWPYSVHYPMEAQEALVAKYRERKAIKDPVYAAMIEAMDRSIGRFLDHLEATGIAENTLVISTDCYPTLLQPAGLQLDADTRLDGENIIPLMRQSGDIKRESIYFHYPNYAFHKKNRLASAIRTRSYKLIKRYDGDSLELYDLTADIGEARNLAVELPEVTERMQIDLVAWLKEAGAQLPTRKPR